MRKLFFMAVALLMMSSLAFAIPYAGNLSASTAVYPDQAINATLSYRLNEACTTATVEIINSSDAVVRTLAGGTAYGLNTITWDGQDEFAANVPTGDYKFRVKIEHDGRGAWANITPMSFNVQRTWFQPVTEAGSSGSAGNDRGIALDAASGKLIFSTTDPRKITILNEADGTNTGQFFSLTNLVNPHGFAGPLATSLDGWLGPYDVERRASDGKVFLGAYITNAGLFEVDTATTTQLTYRSDRFAFSNREIELPNSTLCYASNAGGAALRILKSDEGTSYPTLIEQVTTIDFRHAICAKPSNTGGDGDVIWGFTYPQTMKKYVRSGGVWAEDTSFVVTSIRNFAAEYASIAGKDIIITWNEENDIGNLRFYDGDTGAVLETWVLPEARVKWASNADLCVVPTGANTGVIYYLAPEHLQYGKLTYAYGEIGSAQYYGPRGICTIKSQESPAYGSIFINNSYPAISANNGATATEQGLYLLNNDMTFAGGDAASAMTAAGHPVSNPWIPTDSWSPWKSRVSQDGKVVTVGDWGTLGTSDAVYRVDFSGASPVTTKLLVEGGTNHGRVSACQIYTSGTVGQLVGVDRDGDTDTYPNILRWEIGSTTENYTGAVARDYGDTQYSGGYTIREVAVDSSGLWYFISRRWNNTEYMVYCVDPTDPATGAYIWRSSAAAQGWASGSYPSSCDLDESRNKLFVLNDGGRFFASVNMTTGASAGDNVTYSTSGGCSLTVDDVGNVLTSNNTDEHVRMWAPPTGYVSNTTTYAGVIKRHPDEVKDWMVY